MPSHIGRYAILRKLGEGGMGIVYAAQDERLDRIVAIKAMSSLRDDEDARKRFWREARAAASVNHPNICQLYEIGEDRGDLFIAMELLEGEALSDRLRRGPISVADALPIALGMLAALTALHGRGIVHRDLKPSNVFLTPHGIKLLDFGLARTADVGGARAMNSLTDLTGTGMIVGTPRYMAPEQVTGEPLDSRSDLFAAGAILFEMLAGRPAFNGANVVEVLHATVHEHPPALTGSSAVAAVDRVIRHALAKRPAERPTSAEAMAEELRAISGSGHDTPVVARALTRIVVLPFRILRPDPETDFLAFSLSDAIATSLAGFGSLIVRSSATAARFGAEMPDLKTLAAEADVDRVVMGTLLRSGDQVQATAQLIEAPGGTLLASHSVLSSLGNLFGLQNDITKRVVEALALPLGRLEVSPTPETPRDARAYALYLEANDLARSHGNVLRARDLYRACVERDPNFAPAWAQLARWQRMIAKFIEPSEEGKVQAAEALRRAIEIDPHLPLAHKLSARVEAETGHAREAMVRLVTEAARRGNDAELIAGLVHACRYLGLYDQSIAAHYEARRLDPNVATGFEQTVLMTGDVDRLLALEPRRGEVGGDQVIRVIALGLAGRRDEALRRLDAIEGPKNVPAFRLWTEFVRAWLARRVDDMRAIRAQFQGLALVDDPEAMFSDGWFTCDVGDHEHGLELLRRAVRGGYLATPTLERSPHFDGVRTDPAFQSLLAESVAGRDLALAAFRDAGGERLLGR